MCVGRLVTDVEQPSLNVVAPFQGLGSELYESKKELRRSSIDCGCDVTS